MSTKPTYEIPDFFERHRRERELPVGIGVPEFEQALLLQIVSTSKSPVHKSTLAWEARRYLETDRDERVFLGYIDCLERLRYVFKDGLKYTLTPIGQARMNELVKKLQAAGQAISYWRAA